MRLPARASAARASSRSSRTTTPACSRPGRPTATPDQPARPLPAAGHPHNQTIVASPENPMPAYSLDQLQADVQNGEIDTVLVAFPDMQGRLIGKRFQAEFFLEGAHDETHAC